MQEFPRNQSLELLLEKFPGISSKQVTKTGEIGEIPGPGVCINANVKYYTQHILRDEYIEIIIKYNLNNY